MSSQLQCLRVLLSEDGSVSVTDVCLMAPSSVSASSDEDAGYSGQRWLPDGWSISVIRRIISPPPNRPENDELLTKVSSKDCTHSFHLHSEDIADDIQEDTIHDAELFEDMFGQERL